MNRTDRLMGIITHLLITYRVQPKGERTTLTITQNNISSLEKKIHSAQNWGMVLKGLKDLLEQ